MSNRIRLYAPWSLWSEKVPGHFATITREFSWLSTTRHDGIVWLHYHSQYITDPDQLPTFYPMKGN